ncbi:MAG: hypothetical protein J6L64_08795 [Opitutales bacterium]|nr:hypothetical protein [Opitutales bacterium]
MKRICFALLVLFSVFAPATVAYAESREEIARKLYGCIYVTENESEADYCVFVEEYSAFADLDVGLLNYWEFLDAPGEWCFVDSIIEADFCVYLVDHPGSADITVFFIE